MHKRTLLIALAATPLAACGFRLRGAPEFGFATLYVPGTSAFVRELRRQLQASGGKLTVLTEPAQQAQAEATVDILSERQERVVVGQNASGQVRELQLRLRVRFRLRGPQGDEWIPDTELLQQRDITYNETIALSKEGEEAMLFRDMQSDLVMQLMRRLAAIKPPARP
ncbi:LPS assembly lipoprotein LptE [Paracidovorax wautersii]|uniref:LPS-assembly lipoprotein LptE n=1 Tax=Paracidovorax wautersii TaxID=1177982 RepID=A0ABU1IAU8_9BURK|nr:LPS assembly lipoprotein LptE [Paracidovorax wautersii]MDR6213962.1 LPS-assembly lipoprotein [Paracidovorax wautersii]